MLIRIDESVVRNIADNIHSLSDESPEIIGLNNLAKAAREGRHIIIGSLEVLEYLKGLTILDQISLRIYHGLYSRFAFLSAYEDYFTDYINVRGDDKIIKRRMFGGHNIFEIPLTVFSDVYTTLRTSLVSEDHSDCEFYVMLAKKYLAETMPSHNINLNFDPEGGGGLNTYKSYESKIQSNKIVLAIADSDKNYPDDNKGQTLKELIKIYERYQDTAITDLYYPNVREKENLVPPSFYLLCTNRSKYEDILKLQKIEGDPVHCDKLKYLDIKDGIKAKVYKSNPNVKEYITELATDYSELVSCAIEDIEAQDDEFKIIGGIGGQLTNFTSEILGDGLEKQYSYKRTIAGVPQEVLTEIQLSLEFKKHLFDNLPEYLKPEWEKLCKKVIAWGCSEHMVAI